jgi:hypothetical protein
VWIEPALRPKNPDHEAMADAMAELFEDIRADASYDGWLERPAPTTDYADLNWTTKNRDIIRKQAARIGAILKKQ